MPCYDPDYPSNPTPGTHELIKREVIDNYTMTLKEIENLCQHVLTSDEALSTAAPDHLLATMILAIINKHWMNKTW